MGIRIIEDREGDGAVLIDTTTGIAFGPVFEDAEEVEAFLEWHGGGVRWLNNTELADRLYKFRTERKDWEAEKAAAEADED